MFEADPLICRQCGGTLRIIAFTEDTLALASDGTLWAWGGGALGNGQPQSGYSAVPVQVRDPSDPSGLFRDAAFAAAGLNRTYAVKQDGTVWTWGSNYRNTLGAGGGLCREAERDDLKEIFLSPAGMTFFAHK